MILGVDNVVDGRPDVPVSEDPHVARLSKEVAALRVELASARTKADSYEKLLVFAGHELRTPMHALGLHFELLARLSGSMEDAALNRQLLRARRVLRAYTLRCSTLLDIARIGEGAFTLHRESVVVREVIDDVLELYAVNAERAAVTTSVRPGLVGHWDRTAIEIIIANLVSNALKYGDGASVTIDAVPDGRDNAVIRIIDAGPGIEKSQRAQVFEKFTRGLDAGATPTGYGVGLWVARQLTSLHGGTLVLDDACRHGTSIVVTLPMALGVLEQEG
jgi:signal transduction histidine kinase